MILSYTPLARQDLHEIEDYIKNELADPQAAKNMINTILIRDGRTDYINYLFSEH